METNKAKFIDGLCDGENNVRDDLDAVPTSMDDSITFDPLSWLAYDVHVLNDQTLEHVHHGPIVAPVEPQIQFPVEPQPNLVNVPLENHVHVEPRVESQVILQP